MTKGFGISERDEKRGGKMGGSGGDWDSIKTKKMMMKRNVQRLGGRSGLSLESFANAKTRNDSFNPALIKKKREFYKNAKYVQKYKLSLKQQEQPHIPPSTALKEGYQVKEGEKIRPNKKSMKNTQSLDEVYEKKRAEEEKARQEREAMIEAKKEARQQAEARRKSLKEKMYKRTKFGQPVMKYRIEHLLETIQAATD